MEEEDMYATNYHPRSSTNVAVGKLLNYIIKKKRKEKGMTRVSDISGRNTQKEEFH